MEINQQKFKMKEKKDIEILNKKYSLLDITEVAYNEDGKLFAFAIRDIPPSIKISPELLKL